jgi:bifunctional non-homologous end joining protein LigD
MSPKAEDKEILKVAGREVAVSNPGKVLFPQAGYTKLDLARYYVSVAEGALRGAGGRPNVLVRHPNGVGGEFFYQKRAPALRPEFIDVVTLRFPSGRSAEEIVPRDAAALVWMANLACLELHPHAVRADDLDHPDELRVDLDPMPGVEWPQLREVAQIAHATLQDYGLQGWPKTSGSRGIHIQVRIAQRWTFDQVRRAALALAREVERRAPQLATSKWWKEERHGVFLDYNQNAKDRTVCSAYSVRPTVDARVSAPLTWEELARCEPAEFTLATMPQRFAEVGDRHAEIDADPGQLDQLLELAQSHERAGQGDAPWPPHYQKQEGEPERVQPSRARKRPAGAGKSRLKTASAFAADGGAGASEGADNSALKAVSDLAADGGEHRAAAEPAPAAASLAARAASPTGRRVSKFPLIEIARAQKKDAALVGLERWKARHPEAAVHLLPPDVLVDAMRGRYTTWTRIRINLVHVPEALRPAQAELDPNDAPDQEPAAADWRKRS